MEENNHFAMFGLGCFWYSDALYGAQKGVISTSVGYSGGKTKSPNYANIGDHIEVVRIQFSPSIITYENLLDIFWRNHDPTSKPYKHQYISAILYYNEEQKNSAISSKKQREKPTRPFTTLIQEVTDFYEAEFYHHKYYLRGSPLIQKFEGISHREFIDSPIAAKLNGFLCGIKSLEEFEELTKDFDLTKEQKSYIVHQIKSGVNSLNC